MSKGPLSQINDLLEPGWDMLPPHMRLERLKQANQLLAQLLETKAERLTATPPASR